MEPFSLCDKHFKTLRDSLRRVNDNSGWTEDFGVQLPLWRSGSRSKWLRNFLILSILQVLLTLLNSDLFEILEACCNGTLSEVEVKWHKKCSIGIVMATRGYPGDFKKNVPIRSRFILNEWVGVSISPISLRNWENRKKLF